MAELVPRAVDGIVGGITNDDAVDEMVAEAAAGGSVSGFHIHLENFEGPFDLLLSLISRRKLDVTEVALSQVTDEFLSYLAAAARWDLGQATEFLVVAATLLDLKTARLLPSADVEDEEDLALLEARDLLFARLLQYRAYKLAAAYLAELEAGQARRHGRSVELEARFTELLPEVVIGVSPARFAAHAALALTPKPVPDVATEHVHSPRVSVREHMAIIRELLHRSGSATFRTLVGDCTETLEVVARFLGLLELYREGVVGFDQVSALGELRVRWTGDPESSTADSNGDRARAATGDLGDELGDEPDTAQVMDEEYG
jgi:segregation and condensation protein A